MLADVGQLDTPGERPLRQFTQRCTRFRTHAYESAYTDEGWWRGGRCVSVAVCTSKPPPATSPCRFPAAMAGTDYSSYLRIDDLLRLQQPLSEGAGDEMLFIVVHQAYELWFKVVLQELERARSFLMVGEPWSAAPRLRRAVAVEELLLHQLGVLETMSPEGFLEFRDPLAPASGFQSTQFREIEAVSAGTAPTHAESPLRSEEQRDALRRRAKEPTLWDALCEALMRRGFVEPERTEAAGAAVPDAGASPLVAAIAAIYREHPDPVRAAFHQVFELMVDHDEAVARWRFRHGLMAAREIGRRTGTGGSLGVAYLESTLGERFFPVLWEVRSVL